MPQNRIFLLDAMALLYRSHFAFISNPRITSNGLDTSAIFGFTNTLLEILTKEDPSHVGVVFDTSAPTFRHEQYPEYKANREAQPDALIAIRPYVHRLLDAFNVKRLALDGYEADDIIGTIAHRCADENSEIFMVTPDKDYAQLVMPNVFMYKPQYRGGGYDVLGPAEIEEKFGIPPRLIVDYLGLKGDSVDNIPGVPKIGEKTAVKLLTEYGSMEEVLDKAESITRKSWRETLTTHKEQALLSKQLATIKTDVPIPCELDELLVEHADLEVLMPLLSELEFRTTTGRILNSKLNPVQRQQTDLFGNVVGREYGTTTEGEEVDVLEMMGEESDEKQTSEWSILDQAGQRAKFVEKALKHGSFCFDTETTGLDPMRAELVGLALALKSGEGFYVPLPEDRGETLAILAEFDALWQDDSVVKIGQNLKYDLLMLRNYDIEVVPPFFDTMLAHYVLEPEGKHGMDAMARELLDYETIPIEELIGKKGKNQKTMREVPVEEVAPYAAEDADVTLRLHERLAPEVAGNKVFEEVDMPLVPVLTRIEYEGIAINEPTLRDYSEELGQRLVQLEKKIYEAAEEEFNIGSPKQLGTILFEKMDLGRGKKAKKTKTGQYQTGEAILRDLAIHHEIAADVLAYRGISKLKSTYVDALPTLVNPKTGRIHTTFSQSVAVTGRLSSSNPNLQNIPIRTADGREIRKAFVPRNEDYVLLSADYSQVELRIMAALSEDEGMIEAFRNNEDIHRAAAARVFGIPPEEVDSMQRSRAKQVNFGIIYGISAFGLAQRMGIDRREASDIIKTYFKNYPKVKAYMNDIIARAREQGYVETVFGRRRNLPEIYSRNANIRSVAERNAINSPIQGTAADIIKLAMISLDAEMQRRKLRSRMILQVHDELLFDAHRDEVDALRELVIEKMEGAAPGLIVPLEVEAGVGENWLEAH